MDEKRGPDDQPAGDDPASEERHGTPFGLESSIPGVGVHGAQDEQVRPPSTADQDDAEANDDEAPPLV